MFYCVQIGFVQYFIFLIMLNSFTIPSQLRVVSAWFLVCVIVFLAIYTTLALYEKYEDQVDAAAEMAMVQVNKQYAVLDAKVLQKIPRGPFANKKQHWVCSFSSKLQPCPVLVSYNFSLL